MLPKPVVGDYRLTFHSETYEEDEAEIYIFDTHANSTRIVLPIITGGAYTQTIVLNTGGETPHYTRYADFDTLLALIELVNQTNMFPEQGTYNHLKLHTTAAKRVYASNQNAGRHIIQNLIRWLENSTPDKTISTPADSWLLSEAQLVYNDL